MAGFFTISFQAGLWALIAGAYALLNLALALAALLTPHRDRGYVWIGITAVLLGLMFAGNLAYLLTTSIADSPALLRIFVFRNAFGLAGLVSTLVTIWVIFRHDR